MFFNIAIIKTVKNILILTDIIVLLNNLIASLHFLKNMSVIK